MNGHPADARSRDALGRKYQALTTATSSWKKMAAKGEKFPRHSSQTKAIAAVLGGLLERIKHDLEPVAGGEPLAPLAIEFRILAAYQIWNVFRTKFTQRLDTDLEPFLHAADELAWLCYKPAREAALDPDDPACKEPPFVFLGGDISPFVDARDDRFQVEGVPKQLLIEYGWSDAVMRLPFALIGLPWFQTGFLPSTLAVAHEVGHAVESDFALHVTLKESLESLAKSTGSRGSSWKLWRGELFADMWGCLSLGPAFVRMLSDFSRLPYVNDPAVNLTGAYPPPPLRIYWNACVLHELAFIDEAADVWAEWKALGPFSFAEEFLGDAEAIAQAWLKAPYKGLRDRSLTSVLTFNREQETKAIDQAATAVAGKADGHSDVRVLWASVQKAYEQKATERLLVRILASTSNKPRAARSTPNQKARESYLRTLGQKFV